jgi:hypothetical protein
MNELVISEKQTGDLLAAEEVNAIVQAINELIQGHSLNINVIAFYFYGFWSLRIQDNAQLCLRPFHALGGQTRQLI